MTERDALNEEIVRTMRKLNAMSRRGPDPHAEHRGEGAPPPDAVRDHGRGRIMGILADRGPVCQSKLAEFLDIRPQSLSELICKMEADGLINRQQSEEDRRQTIVSLTEEGSARVSAFRESHRRHAEEFLAPLTEEEKIALCAILKKLAEGRTAHTQAADARD